MWATARACRARTGAPWCQRAAQLPRGRRRPLVGPVSLKQAGPKAASAADPQSGGSADAVRLLPDPNSAAKGGLAPLIDVDVLHILGGRHARAPDVAGTDAEMLCERFAGSAVPLLAPLNTLRATLPHTVMDGYPKMGAGIDMRMTATGSSQRLSN